MLGSIWYGVRARSLVGVYRGLVVLRVIVQSRCRWCADVTAIQDMQRLDQVCVGSGYSVTRPYGVSLGLWISIGV